MVGLEARAAAVRAWPAAAFLLAVAACSASADAPCTSSAECGTGTVCDVGHARCVGCVTAADCGGDPTVTCLAHACVTSTTCVSSRECPGAVCDRTSGICADCVSSADCTAGDVCASGNCIAPPPVCASDRDCSAMGRVCDLISGVCVECVHATDCPAGMTCTMSRHCVPPDAGVDGGDADLGPDAGVDLGSDGGADLGDTDLGPDGGVDLGDTDLGVDAGTDLGFDAGIDFGTDFGMDFGPFDAGPGIDGYVGDLGQDFGPPYDAGMSFTAGACADALGLTCGTAIAMPALGPGGGGFTVTGTVPATGSRWIALSFPFGAPVGAPRVIVSPAASFAMTLSSTCTPSTTLACGVEGTTASAITDYEFAITDTTDSSDLSTWPSTVYVQITRLPAAPSCASDTFTLMVSR